MEYNVLITPFASKHYCKEFHKKYPRKFDIVLDAIEEEYIHYEIFSKTDRLEILSNCNDLCLLNSKFRIPGEQVSAKASGNRVIAVLDSHNFEISILMIYTKNHIVGKLETSWFKKILRKEFPEYIDILKE